MPNASEYKGRSPHKILVLAPTGHGKTSQFLTLPGKKFIYLFDPNAILTLRGHDVEYEEFLPDAIPLTVHSLSKEVNKAIPKTQMKSKRYEEWENDFNQKMSTGYFDQFDWLGIDSCTTLLDLIMDRVLTLNGRYGQWPHEDDYGPQMITFKNLVREWTSLGKGIYFTGHLDIRQDQITKRVWENPMMTGRLRQQIPLMFSDIFSIVSEPDKDGKQQYLLRTTNDRTQQFHRTSMHLDPFENVTIDWKQPVEGQGLGDIINSWARKQGALTVVK